MSTPLILFAASGLAREALEAVRASGEYDVIGIVDDNPRLSGELVSGIKVLGGVDVVQDYPDAAVLPCAGKGTVRESLAERLDLDEARYATVVHPSVTVPPTCAVGIGSILLAGCVLTTSVTLGRHVVVMPNVTLTHDDAVEDYATLCAGVTLGGGVHIGARAYVGMNATVRERVTVGNDAVIGMGAAVLHDVPSAQTWIGVPARPLVEHPLGGP